MPSPVSSVQIEIADCKGLLGISLLRIYQMRMYKLHSWILSGSYYMGGESPYQSSKPTIVHQPHVMRSSNNTEKHGTLPPIPPSYTVHN